MSWRVEFLDDDVRAVLNAMPEDIGASFQRIAEMIGSYGLERMRELYVKHLQGPLRGMRMKGRDGIARAAYVTATGRRVVVVHVFPKKTQRTPRREIETALRKAKEVERLANIFPFRKPLRSGRRIPSSWLLTTR